MNVGLPTGDAGCSGLGGEAESTSRSLLGWLTKTWTQLQLTSNEEEMQEVHLQGF